MIGPSELHNRVANLKTGLISRRVLVKFRYPCEGDSGALDSLDSSLDYNSMGSWLCFLLLLYFLFFLRLSICV